MRKIDEKYKTSGDLTKLDGTPIPEDEPLILFRAHDRVLVQLLEYYKELCKSNGSPDKQLDLLTKVINDIKSWQEANPDKLKAAD